MKALTVILALALTMFAATSHAYDDGPEKPCLIKFSNQIGLFDTKTNFTGDTPSHHNGSPSRGSKSQAVQDAS